MSDIEFIKWMCEKAEGFTIDIGQDGSEQYYFISDPNDFDNELDESFFKDNILYPLLLQRAIEGVNRDHYTVFVDQFYFGVSVKGTGIEDANWEFTEIDVDQAKEAALKYTYEQERS